MDNETKDFLETMFTDLVGYVPENEDELIHVHNVSNGEDSIYILKELCNAVGMFEECST